MSKVEKGRGRGRWIRVAAAAREPSPIETRMERAEQADGGARDAGGGVVREVDREERGEREEGGA